MALKLTCSLLVCNLICCKCAGTALQALFDDSWVGKDSLVIRVLPGMCLLVYACW